MPQSVFTDAYAAFLNKMVEARKASGLRQAQLSKKLGKPQPWVSNYERGVRRLDIIEFYAIARALRVDPIELFEEIVEVLPKNVTI